MNLILKQWLTTTADGINIKKENLDMKTDLRCVPGKKKYSPIENAVHYIDIYK